MEERNFLLEIGTEELPAGYIGPALDQLEAAGRKLAPGSVVEVRGTPRRLVLWIEGLPRYRTLTVWGPPLDRARDEEGNWNRAAEGFARSRGKEVSELETGEKDGRTYLRATVRRDQGEELTKEVPEIIRSLSFPKSMRWVTGSKFRFARPIRWLVCLWGKDVLPVRVAGVKAGRATYGHRFFGAGPWKIPAADLRGYEACLKKNYVLVDPSARKKKLLAALLKEEKKHRPGIKESDLDAALLDEVNNLVEYPRVVEGGFEKNYLTLPEAVLATVMKSHQRYFPVGGSRGGLLNRFLLVANGPYRSVAAIRKNNERVLRARLADAEFFWQEDLKRTLEERTPELKAVIFHAKIGNYAEKVERLEKLASRIAGLLGCSRDARKRVRRGASLSKSDLVTAMVTEFTELQGIMGSEYARRQGEDEEVAEALREQYLPRSAEDLLPATEAGRALSLADKIDTVTAFLNVGIKPSGSQDPYGLRRQAQGAVRLMIETKMPLSLPDLIRDALAGLGVEGEESEEKLALILDFFQARLEAYLEGQGAPSDAIKAVLASGWDDLLDVGRRIETLKKLQGKKALLAATTIVERTFNICREADLSGREEVKEKLLSAPSEKELFRVYSDQASSIVGLIEEGKYDAATELYAKVFSRPLHDFFDEVLVNVEDPDLRRNRLVLLSKINRLYSEKVADLSLLQFERGEHII